MKVEISGVRLTITKDINDFIQKKIKKINKYLKNITTSHVILKSEKDRYETEINILAKGLVINAREVANDLYTSIEGAIKKIINQSKKYKEKKKSHKVSGYKKALQIEQEAGIQSDAEPAILRITKRLAKPMEVEEAAMQLKSSSNSFLVFLNAETNQINVIYKKENGNFTLVEPS